MGRTGCERTPGPDGRGGGRRTHSEGHPRLPCRPDARTTIRPSRLARTCRHRRRQSELSAKVVRASTNSTSGKQAPILRHRLGVERRVVGRQGCRHVDAYASRAIESLWDLHQFPVGPPLRILGAEEAHRVCPSSGRTPSAMDLRRSSAEQESDDDAGSRFRDEDGPGTSLGRLRCVGVESAIQRCRVVVGTPRAADMSRKDQPSPCILAANSRLSSRVIPENAASPSDAGRCLSCSSGHPKFGPKGVQETGPPEGRGRTRSRRSGLPA